MNITSDRVKKFTGIYSDFYSVVYNGINARVHNEDVSDELAQEVFTRFYEKMDYVESPRKWLLGTLKFVLLEHYRKNSAVQVDIDEIFFDQSIQYTNRFMDTRIILQDALDAAENYRDEKDRIVYELVAIRNFTHEEVADLLSLTKRQVYYRYKTVGYRLMDYLKKKGVKNLEELL